MREKIRQSLRAWRFQPLPILGLILTMIWMWRVYDLAHELPTRPSSGDSLEVIWLLEYTLAGLRELRVPLTSPDLWHPVGVFFGALGISPLIYWMMLPAGALFGATAAYNIAQLAGIGLLFATSYHLCRRFANRGPATVGALLFCFSPFMVDRVVLGHINIVWGAVLIPPILGSLIDMATSTETRDIRRAAIKVGVLWGILIALQLYGVWWGGLLWVTSFGISILRTKKVSGALAAVIALAVGSPWILLYAIQSREAQLVSDALPALVGWGASLNSLFIPSVSHPIKLVRDLSTSIYAGTQNESGTANWGMVLLGVAVFGALIARRVKIPGPTRWLLCLLALLAGVLAFGPTVKWNGVPIQAPILAPLDAAIWRVGHAVKPGLFMSEDPIPALASVFPAPGYALMAVLPQWESARVYARFSMLMGLVLALFATVALQYVSAWPRALLMVVLILEGLPAPTSTSLMPTSPHPAYTWLSANAQEGMRARGWNILDITDEPDLAPIYQSGRPAYAGALTGVAIASGISSYPPKHIVELRALLGQAEAWAADARTPLFMRNLRVGYVFLHRVFLTNNRVWESISRSPYFAIEGCFGPGSDRDVFPEEICVARAKWLDGGTPSVDIIPSYDWSLESWGIWAMSTQAEANWIATQVTDHTLTLRAFPACKTGESQTVAIFVNDVQIGSHDWTSCDSVELVFRVPAAIVLRGWNKFALRSAYTTIPSSETRTLAVGFSEMTFSIAP